MTMYFLNFKLAKCQTIRQSDNSSTKRKGKIKKMRSVAWNYEMTPFVCCVRQKCSETKQKCELWLISQLKEWEWEWNSTASNRHNKLYTYFIIFKASLRSCSFTTKVSSWRSPSTVSIVQFIFWKHIHYIQYSTGWSALQLPPQEFRRCKLLAFLRVQTRLWSPQKWSLRIHYLIKFIWLIFLIF